MKNLIGTNIIGTVSGITKYGIFVNLDNGYTGLIHISEISSKFVFDIYKYATVGKKIKSVVVDVDDERKQLKLSLKRVLPMKYGRTNFNEKFDGFDTLYKKRNFWIQEYLKNKKITKYY